MTIALAESLLRQGEYVKAKHLLAASVSRNRRFTRTHPKSVGALWGAYGTVAFQEGDTRISQRAMSRRMQILVENLPAADSAGAFATIAAGDMWVKLGNLPMAETVYRAAELRAARQGHSTAEATATLRRVWIAHSTGHGARAHQLLATISREGDPAIQRNLRIVEAYLKMQGTSTADINELVASTVPDIAGEPTLLWASSIPSPGKDARKSKRLDPTPVVGDDLPSGITWFDIGFVIKQDGTTDAVEILRGNAGPAQTRDVISQVRGRRYATQDGNAALSRSYRVERITYRGTHLTPLGSRIRRRWGLADVSVLDLTRDSTKAPIAQYPSVFCDYPERLDRSSPHERN